MLKSKLLHRVVIYTFKWNNLNRPNLKWSANGGPKLLVSVPQMLALPRWLSALPSSLSCVPVCGHILTLRQLSQGCSRPQEGSKNRSWNIVCTALPRQRYELTQAIAVDEVSREVILSQKDENRGEREPRCLSPSYKSSYLCQHVVECCQNTVHKERQRRIRRVSAAACSMEPYKRIREVLACSRRKVRRLEVNIVSAKTPFTPDVTSDQFMKRTRMSSCLVLSLLRRSHPQCSRPFVKLKCFWVRSGASITCKEIHHEKCSWAFEPRLWAFSGKWGRSCCYHACTDLENTEAAASETPHQVPAAWE